MVLILIKKSLSSLEKQVKNLLSRLDIIEDTEDDPEANSNTELLKGSNISDDCLIKTEEKMLV